MLFGNLNERVAIVTGSGANIGEACAKALAGAGAHVVVADINLGAAETVAAAIVASGGSAMAHYLDLAEEQSIIDLVSATVAKYGRIDILHNNAADTRPDFMAQDKSIPEMTTEVWDRTFAINTRGPMLMIKHVAPHMITGGGGSIINTGSGSAILGDVFHPAYSTSKGALHTLTRNVAAQLGRHNIRCNAVLPGLVLSKGAREIMTAGEIDFIQRHVLLPRQSTPEDIAGPVLFLASDAGSFVTAQVFSADGGIVHHSPYYADVMAMNETA
ncbi:MAG: SDR family oxidoreductase [Novosphingobium sp.]|uniref:SDR family NAD(P)-dependent oxidoreductase n=1 Tax=Novosphingobium sp. TaxID=1874826 RepID=UPI00273640AF|nr:SDR family oxidoreductase [Novosphingobium sp.]MDP3552199.1 SDR family oxidoreductase [Novosphingobium sp.]